MELDCHLATCDFCCAELHLLAAHPPLDVNIDCPPIQIPIHLYALARALLASPQRAANFAETLHAHAGMTLTDA